MPALVDAVVTYARRCLRAALLVWRAGPRLTTISVVAAVVAGALAPLQLWLMKMVLDTLTSVEGSVGSDARGVSAAFFGALLATWLTGRLCSAAASTYREQLACKSEQYTRGLVLEKNAVLDVAFFDHPEFYDSMDNALRETGQMHSLLATLLGLAQQLLGLIGSFIILLYLHPLAPILLLLAVLPEAVISSRFSARWVDLLSSRASGRRMAGYVAGLLSSRSTIKEVRVFGLATALVERFRALLDGFYDENRALWSHELRARIGVTLIATVGAGLVGLHVIESAVSGSITIGDTAMHLGAVRAVWGGLSGLVVVGAAVGKQTMFIGNLFGFLDVSADGYEGALQRPKGDTLRVAAALEEGLEFSHVTFAYPGSRAPVLDDVSFSIPARKTTAIVGRNAAGKTTLIKLLMRLYDPTEGQVLLEGRDIRQYTLSDVYAQFAVVFQDFVCYNLTARENVGFGDLERMDEQECLDVAARRAGALELIEGLPDGWDTYLGRVFGNGVDPSIGQWQKLALARAFMRDAQVYILDEPTASLDAIAEREFYESVHELTRGKTTVFISHRFSTVRMADKIIVLDDGRIVEQGSHDELMAMDGHYAEMFNAQAERYR